MGAVSCAYNHRCIETRRDQYNLYPGHKGGTDWNETAFSVEGGGGTVFRRLFRRETDCGCAVLLVLGVLKAQLPVAAAGATARRIPRSHRTLHCAHRALS